MIKSELATEVYQATQYSKGRSGRKIEAITIHHMAGIMSAKQCGLFFQSNKRQASSNYGVGYNGEIACYVGEEDTSWCNSNWDSNCKSVTIETSNDKTGGEWHVSDKSIESLVKLVADISKRNNLGTLVKGKNVTWHSMFANTNCPGSYLMSKFDYIIEEANKLNNSTPTPTPTPEPAPTPAEQKFKIGDRVIISGGLYVNANSEKPSGSIKSRTTTITRYVKGTKHPYNTTGDLGWMNEEDIKLATEKVTYTIKAGDTLSGIAKKYGTTWQKIYADNKAVIGNNPNLIHIGTVLNINK